MIKCSVCKSPEGEVTFSEKGQKIKFTFTCQCGQQTKWLVDKPKKRGISVSNK